MQTPGGGIIASTVQDIINWHVPIPYGRSLLPPVVVGIEMMSVASSKFDFSRFGFEVARASPRQADVIIIAGTVTNKMAPVLKRL
jgi:NADH-quinone oxidoreductase subunit B